MGNLLAGAIDPNDKPGDTAAWWIETRMTWESIISPDVKYPIRTEIVRLTRDNLKRFGDSHIVSSESRPEAVDRVVSMLNVTALSYRHLELAGEISRRIRWTNDRLPSHHVYWHAALDVALRGRINGPIGVIEREDTKISVREDTVGDLGNFSGLEAFSGLQGL
jgi:hypothetical protein